MARWVDPYVGYGDYDKWLADSQAAQQEALDAARAESNRISLQNSLSNQLHNQRLQVAGQPLEYRRGELSLAQQRAQAAQALANMRMQSQRMQLNSMQQGNIMNQNYGVAAARRLLGF